MPYKLSNYEINGTWNQHHSIVLDVILDRTFNAFYNSAKNIPKSWRSPDVIAVSNSFIGGLFNPITITYLIGRPIEAFSLQEGYEVEADDDALTNNDKYQQFVSKMKEHENVSRQDIEIPLNTTNLFKNYPILAKYKYKLSDIIQTIENTKFKMNYNVKCIVKPPAYNKAGKMKHKGVYAGIDYEMTDYQQMFEVDIGEDLYKFNFKTPLGKMILHNMVVLDTDWLPVEAHGLRKNAYFIYKRFILNRVSGRNKPKQIELWSSDIKTYLDLNWNNPSGIYTTIEKALDELKEKGLIRVYGWDSYRKERRYLISFSDEKIPARKGSSTDDQVLKFAE